MKEILALLIAIQRTAKDVHYHAKGRDFWGDHLLADRIYDDIDGFIDDIFENWYLGKEEEAPLQKNIYADAVANMYESDDLDGMLRRLDDLIFKCIGIIQLLPESELTAGDNDLLGRICSDLQKKYGFLVRRMK